MSDDTLRILNASLACLLAFVWVLWSCVTLEHLASRLVAFSLAPFWCLFAMNAYDAAVNNLPLARYAHWYPLAIGLPVLAVCTDIAFGPKWRAWWKARSEQR